MRKAIALVLTLVMLSQALPWTAFASAVEPVSEAELNRALQIAGLRQDPEYPLYNESGEMTLRLTAKESLYHTGMEPEGTWDALTLVDWLGDKLSKDFYNVASVFSRADSMLQRMKTDDPASYASFTSSEYAGFEYKLHTYMIQTESIKEMRLSQRVRGATDALSDLRGQALSFSQEEQQTAKAYQRIIDGVDEPAFSKWLHALLNSVEGPQTTSVPADQVKLSAGNTLRSRLGAGGSVLKNDSSGDIYITVINKNEFALEFHGVNNEPLAGIKATVRDYNNPDTVLEGMSVDPKRGNIVFDATAFVNDFDYGMELIIDVDASAAGYRSFYIPWALVGQGKVLRYYLTLLTGPEEKDANDNRTRQEKEAEAIQLNAEGKVKPYAYKCTFNGYDILKQAKSTKISPLLDADISFEPVIRHTNRSAPVDPVLHYKATVDEFFTSEWREMKPTKTTSISEEETSYTYTKDFKRILSTGLVKDESPYFVIRETGEKVPTKLTPIRATVDKPVYTGQEPSNPMTSVIGEGIGFDFKLPDVFGGVFSVNLPLYWPRATSAAIRCFNSWTRTACAFPRRSSTPRRRSRTIAS